MENLNTQLEIIDQLKNALEALSVQNSSNNLRQNESMVNDNINTGTSTTSAGFDDCLKDFAKKYIDFTYKCPTTFHVVQFASKLLRDNGFTYLSEKEGWDEKITCGKYFTIRNGTNLTAFVIGKNWKPERGVGAIASHVDSLAAKLKPASIKDKVEGFELLGVAPYGGTLNHLWFDRDLGIGGRILYKDDDGDVKDTLIDSTPNPIAKIPTLAPHFGQPALGPFDKEDQAVPVIGFCPENDYKEGDDATDEERKSPLYGKHPLHLLRYIAKLGNIKVSQILQVDLDLFDVQKGTLGGLKEDFLFAPRLDDRLCSFAALWGLIISTKDVDINNFDNFTILGLFDNEEVGSLSRQGAKGGLLEATVARASHAHSEVHSNDIRTVFANSIILSADVNHMFNPNFTNVYMKNHSPKPNVGITLSLDPNAHMATDSVGFAFVEELARKNNDKVQYFQIKNNSRSGGTIGPSLASQTGARTIDLGIAQLAMHSIRATTGSKDVGLGVKFFDGFYRNWRSVYDNYGDL